MNPFSPRILAAAIVIAAAPFALAANTYHSGSLKNGLRYHVLTVPSEPGRIDVRLQVEAGASDENGTSEIGVAHMVEHMVFRSAPGFPDGVGDTLAARGFKRGAHFNAVTNYERTLYMFSPPKGREYLEETLAALAAMVSPHDFSAADWQKEQQVVMAEWRNGQGVAERMNRKRTDLIRSGSRQARYAIIGTSGSIMNTPVAVLQDFHRRWYVPNNMQLMISGDIKPAEAAKLAERYFGSLKAAPLSDRGGRYYEPELQSGWHVGQLQDKDSGGSQAALVFRLGDAASRNHQSSQGTRERLIDRFAARILTDRLRAQQSALPKAVSNVSLRKADIGRHTTAVGLFAAVAPDGHAEGISQLLKLREQILREPVTQAEFAAYRRTLEKTLAEQRRKTTLPEPFGDALQSVSEAAFAGKPVRTSAQSAAIVAPVLNTLTPQDISRRIERWLNAGDKLVQLQAPGLTPLALPAAENIAAEAGRLKTAPLPKLAAKAAASTGQFADAGGQGEISRESREADLQLTRWTLGNGDKVLVLQHPSAGGKIHFRSISGAGYLSGGLNPWQAQLAAQVVWQSAPQGWDNAGLNRWKQQHKIALSHNFQTASARYEGSAPHGEAARLLQLYRAYHTTPQVGADFRDSVMAMIRQIPMRAASERTAAAEAATRLRYGRAAFELPNQAELEAVDENLLLDQWQRSAAAPATHYILTDRPAAELKPLVRRYLADIPRRAAAPAQAHQPLAGAAAEHRAIGGEARSDVSAWSFAESTWQPETAAHIAMLQDLAAGRLKTELRDKALGVYSLKFTSTLNGDSGRVESELRFSSSPERADDLWRLAETTLQAFPDSISDAQAAALKQRFAEQETRRLQSHDTYINRLILSEQHYGDARYLRSMDKLAGSFTAENLRRSARLMWQPENRRVLVVDPKEQGR